MSGLIVMACIIDDRGREEGEEYRVTKEREDEVEGQEAAPRELGISSMAFVRA